MATQTLPIDIIRTDLLPRLPAKTLMRFKCVCKYFLTLISSQEFINLHTHYRNSLSSKEDDRTLYVSGTDSHLYSFSINSLQSAPVQFPLLGIFTLIEDSTIEVIGSCNGLLCLASICCRDYRVNNVNSIVLLNPFTRNFREIPFHYLPGGKISSLGLGFGFDDVNQDYKLVSVTKGYDDSMLVLYVVVYSFASNTWKFLKHDIYPREYLEPKSWSVLVNNHLLHWLFFGDNGFRIGCFDLQTDKWVSDVPSPKHCNNGSTFHYFGYIPVCLRKLDDECLSFCDLRDEPNGFLDLWIMKEYGVEDSWVLYRISTSFFPRIIDPMDPLRLPKWQCLIDPIALKNDKILLKQRGASNLIFVYNIEDGSVTRVDDVAAVAPFVQAYDCKESLAVIPRSADTGPVQNVGFDELIRPPIFLPPWAMVL